MRKTMLMAVSVTAVLWWVGYAASTTPHVVIISIDGLKPDIYRRQRTADIPTLNELAERGASAAGVVGVFPTVTYPSHTTIITGVRPALHGIYTNRMLDPEGQSNG